METVGAFELLFSLLSPLVWWLLFVGGFLLVGRWVYLARAGRDDTT